MKNCQSDLAAKLSVKADVFGVKSWKTLQKMSIADLYLRFACNVVQISLKRMSRSDFQTILKRVRESKGMPHSTPPPYHPHHALASLGEMIGH